MSEDNGNENNKPGMVERDGLIGRLDSLGRVRMKGDALIEKRKRRIEAKRKPRPINAEKLVRDQHHKPMFTRNEIIAALRSTGGLIYIAARQLNCETSTIYRRMQTDPEIREVVRECREETIDIGEAALKKAVLAGEGWAVCFLLKTLGKNRGYVERQEFHVMDDRERAEAAIDEYMTKTGLSRQEAIEMLRPYIPMISELTH